MTLCAQPLADLETQLRSRQVSSVDLVRDALARIAEVNPALNAFCFTYPEDALAEAAERDRDLAERRDRGPLHGIPIAIKDFTPTKGRTTTRGSYALEHWVPDADPVIVRRLKAAGAIVVGKITTPEFVHSGMTTSPLWGITRNPHDPDRTSGGSSGGAAVAVATGCVPMAEGTDMGGSVRIPASCCGVTGFKPSLGRIPMDILPTTFDRISHFGLIARSADCVRRGLGAVEGFDMDDHTSQSAPSPLPATLTGDLRGRHIAFSVDLGFYHVHPEIAARFEDIAIQIEAAGAKVIRADLNWTARQVFKSWSDYWAVILAGCAGQYVPDFGPQMDPNLLAQIDHAKTLPAARMFEIECLWTEQWQALAAVLDRADALICPTMAQPPARAASNEADHYAMNADGRMHSLDMTVPFNSIGRCPVVSVPCGRTGDGLPMGLQIVGRPYDDPTVLDIARGCERLGLFEARAFPDWNARSDKY